MNSKLPSKNSCIGGSIAVLTSGGDSCGMNSAIKGVVTTGTYLGLTVYAVYDGFQGLIDGNIKAISTSEVLEIGRIGGTIFGSSRCEEFCKRSGRLKACRNLIDLNVDKLICIGGDGSLTGANIFHTDWPSLLEDLVAEGKITNTQAKQNSRLQLVGLVGSIDKDFYGTDMSIGFDSALHRIVDAVDNILPTAKSLQRVFIIEVMGGNSGSLALSAALAIEADWIFIPEWPPKVGWQLAMCQKLKQKRNVGQRYNFVITTEIAIDRNGNRITTEDIAKAINDNLPYGTHTTVLGHVQRGGIPSAFDRTFGYQMGVEAVLALMEMSAGCDPLLIASKNDQFVRVPMVDCIKRTESVRQSIEGRNFCLAVELCGDNFQLRLSRYKRMSQM